MKTNDECFDSLMMREETFKKKKKERIRILATVLPVAACFVIMLCMLPMLGRRFNPVGSETTDGSHTEVGSHARPEGVGSAPGTDNSGLVESPDTENDYPEKIISAIPAGMPDDFAIHYETWISGKNIYDTYENYLQKDLVLNGVRKTGLSVSDETLAEIYTAVRDNALDKITREMTSEALTKDDTIVRCEPLTHYSIKFTANGTTYTVTGDWTASEYTKTDDDAAHFWSFIQYMNEIMYNSDEYKSLPEANGGYD